MTSWTLAMVEELVRDEVRLVKWLRQKRFVSHPKRCICGGHKFKLKKKGGKVVFQCTKRTCKHRVSSKPWFMYRWKTPLKEVVKIIYFWAVKTPYNSIVTMTGVSTNLVARIILLVRKGLAKYVQRNPPQLGGDGHVVEMDEVEVARVSCLGVLHPPPTDPPVVDPPRPPK